MSDPTGFPGPSNFPPQGGPTQPFGAPMPPTQAMPPQPGGYGPPPGTQWGVAGPGGPVGPTGGWTPNQQSGGGGSRTGLIIVAIVAVVGLAIAGFLILNKSEDDANDAFKTVNSQIDKALSTIPSVPDLSDITVPEITLPPGVTVPDLSDITIPEITLPPGVTIPDITIPGVPTTTGEPSATTSPAPPTTLPAPPAEVNFFDGTQAADGIAKIAAARGASPLRILEANLYTEYLITDVQDPGTPANVDRFTLRNGSVGPSDPVALTGDGDLESNLFSDNEVNWAAIPGLVGAALQQIPTEGGTVSHVHVSRNLPFSPDVQIRVFVDPGPRGGGGFLDADAQGTIISVNPS